MSSPRATLSEQALSPALRARLGEIRFWQTVGSTNTDLLIHSSELPSFSVSLALAQTAGRGQRQRVWQSQAGDGLYCSLLWHHRGDMRALPPLSIIAALALHETYQKLAATQNFAIKWPNDLVTPCGKLAGILVESKVLSKAESHWIIGMGLNLRPSNVGSLLQYPRADLQTELGAAAITSTDSLYWQAAECWLMTLVDWLLALPKPAALPTLWAAIDVFQQKNVLMRRLDGADEHSEPLTLHGINSDGNLLAKDQTGKMRMMCSGSWSIEWSSVQEVISTQLSSK